MLLINPKTISRIAAVQSIYCHYATNLEINKVISDLKEFYTTEKIKHNDELVALKFNQAYFIELTNSTINNIKFIDDLIGPNLTKGFILAKLHLTLSSIIRVGIAELCYFPQAPFKVVINEFTNIAGSMLAENEVAFVNSLLQNISNINKENLLNDNPFV
jgi:N utilization substance protein B